MICKKVFEQAGNYADSWLILDNSNKWWEKYDYYIEDNKLVNNNYEEKEFDWFSMFEEFEIVNK